LTPRRYVERNARHKQNSLAATGFCAVQIVHNLDSAVRAPSHDHIDTIATEIRAYGEALATAHGLLPAPSRPVIS
jgi:hypothetical protein